MYVVSLTNEDKMAYGVYRKLREYAPKANMETLRQISVYIARSDFNGDIDEDIKLEYREDREDSNVSLLLLSNGIQIEFYDDADVFSFVVSKNENKFSMKTLVFLSNPRDVSTVNIYSELRIKGHGLYVVSFRPKDLSDENSLKYAVINYYTEDEIDWVREIVEEDIDINFDLVAKENFIYPFAEKSEFDLLVQNDMILDGYQGYISNVLTRIDLLYDNMKFIRIKRRKKSR